MNLRSLLKVRPQSPVGIAWRHAKTALRQISLAENPGPIRRDPRETTGCAKRRLERAQQGLMEVEVRRSITQRPFASPRNAESTGFFRLNARLNR